MQDLMPFLGPERRRRIRFPIELGARYAVDGQQVIQGAGRTVNISSQGVLMTTAHKMSPHTAITVAIEWPIFAGNVDPLVLYLSGLAVRSEPGLVAVRFSSHKFRTRLNPPALLHGQRVPT